MNCPTCHADFEKRPETKGRRRLHCYRCKPTRLRRVGLWHMWLRLWRKE